MSVSLIMFKDTGDRKEFQISTGKTVIGRKEDCDLRIPLPEISRKHALLIVDDRGHATLRDSGSANGTYVNNTRVSEQELSPGDHVVIGPVVFTVQINGQPADVRPVHTRLEARTPAASASAVTAKSAHESDAAPDDNIFGDDDDPISALEALASTGDTAAMGLDISETDDS